MLKIQSDRVIIDGHEPTKNYTETTPKVSVDLTTLPGWSALSSGSHNITIAAKAAGYRDSDQSAGVEVTKGGQNYA